MFLYFHLPLHDAVECGHSEAALHFIQLCASVHVEDSDGFLPVECYGQKYMHQFHAELFENRVPTKRTDILQGIARILDHDKQSMHDFDCQVHHVCSSCPMTVRRESFVWPP